MSVSIHDLIDFIDAELKPSLFADYCVNGLQVAGKSQIHTIVTGVSANQALFHKAIEHNADLILVHHGLFWRGDEMALTSIHYERVKLLIQNEINLLAYHLPLDFHPFLGNNIQLAHQLQLEVVDEFALSAKNRLEKGLIAELSSPMQLTHLKQKLTEKLSHAPVCIQGNEREIKRIAWCTGAAGKYISHVANKADAYLTGEVPEHIVHVARELGINCIAAGHHATERYGVMALGALLEQTFGIKHFFVDIDSPI